MSLFKLSGIRSRSVGVLAVTIFFVALAQGKHAHAKASKERPVEPAENIFTNSRVFHIQIEVPEKAMATLREYRWMGWGGPQQKRPAVKCTVREGDKIYHDVAIHLKGAAGSFRPVDADPALTLNFDKHVKGQTFHGLRRISLNNSVQDPSFLSEQICREMFAAAGVPVPRATHAQVELNGRDLGIYVLTEAFNKQFLARHFKNPNGNLYDGGFLKDVTDELEKSSGENPDDRSDLKRVADAALEPNVTNRLARLGKVLDLDRFITLLALDVMMCDWDGYAINKNNYRLYHDPDSDKITFMPHGLDQMFGVMRTDPEMPIFPRMNGLVANAVLQTPEGRKHYQERMSQLLTNVYKVETITNRVWELAAKIRPALAEKSPGAAKAHEREVARLCDRIVQRARSLQEQLTTPDDKLKFGNDGAARFADWKSRADFGNPVFDGSGEAGSKKLLHITATTGSCVGNWFTKVRLEPGRYRFEGRIKGQDVTPDPGDRKGGAGLRISNRRFVQKLTGDSGWMDVAFEFEIQEAQPEFGFMGKIQAAVSEVELICELRAARGEAWFDGESLRLVRK